MASKLAVAQGSEDGSSRTRYGTTTRGGPDVNPNEAERARLKRDSFILLEPRAVHTMQSTVVDHESTKS
jgi:hypothetical protein